MDYCKKMIMKPGMYRLSRCSLGIYKDGYCKIHHPDYIKAKRDKNNLKFNNEINYLDKKSKLSDLQYNLQDVIENGLRLLDSDKIDEAKELFRNSINNIYKAAEEFEKANKEYNDLTKK